MSYIGRGTDKISNIEILDNITFDGSSSYSITKSSVAFTPNSAQSLLISIDGVVQATNFSVSSSTIDFGVAVPSTSTCDFFLHYGVGLITTPADGTVSLAKLSASGTKDATTFLRGDNTFASAGSPSIVDNGNATAITIDSSENVGVGETSPLGKLHVKTGDSGASANAISDELVIEGSGSSGLNILTGSGGNAQIDFGDSADNNIGRIQYNHSDNSLRTTVNATERMRINSDGKVGIGDTALSSNAILSVEGDIGSPLFRLYDKRSTSTVDVMHLSSDFGGTETKNFQIEADGDVQNTNNSYGSLSDRKFKENETDANSQWNDIKALKIKNYNLKKFPDIKHLGVIAQDLEASGMNGLVKNKPDVLYTENEILPEGKNVGDVKEENYKEVKYSVLYMKSVKALQEAIQRIETLEAKVTALENA